jgi:hypothetical protein
MKSLGKEKKTLKFLPAPSIIVMNVKLMDFKPVCGRSLTDLGLPVIALRWENKLTITTLRKVYCLIGRVDCRMHRDGKLNVCDEIGRG